MPDYSKIRSSQLSLIETTRGGTGERSIKTIRHYHQDIRVLSIRSVGEKGPRLTPGAVLRRCIRYEFQ